MLSKKLLLVVLLGLFLPVNVTATELYFHLPAHAGDLMEWYDARIADFQEKHPGVTINVDYSAADFAENITLMVLSGQIPDLVGVMSRDLPLWVEEDLVEDLYPYIEQDPDVDIDDFLPQFIQHYDWGDGRLLAMPINPDTGAVVFNTELIEEAGLPNLVSTWEQGDWTWDTLRSHAMKLTLRDGDRVTQWGLRAADAWEPVWAGFIYSNNGRILNDSLTKSRLDEREAIDAVQWWGNLYRQDQVAEWHGHAGDIEGGNVPIQIRAASAGRLAHAHGVSADFVPLPANQPGNEPTHILLGPGLSMFKDAENKDLAWEFIKECVSHESMEELARLSGRVPSRLSAFDAWLSYYEQYVGTPQMWLEALYASDSLPYGIHWTDIYPIIQQALLRVTRQGVLAATVLEDASRRINVILAE